MKKDKVKERNEKRYVFCDEFSKELGLECIYSGRGGFNVCSINVSRPGLQLAGFLEYFSNESVQVMGNGELKFLDGLSQEQKRTSLTNVISKNIPCIIVSRGLKIDQMILEVAKEYQCPVFSSKLATTVLAHDLMVYLSDLFAPNTVIHGVMLDIFGVGVLLTGHAGIGKSETALDLISRGHRIVADDTVLVKHNGEYLVATCPKRIQYYMEVRGIGIINVKNMFGPGAIRPEKTIDVVAELVKWDDSHEYDRLGDETQTINILDTDLQKLTIPVSPGRNIPIIIETAARKYRLEQFGNSAINELLKNTFKGQ